MVNWKSRLKKVKGYKEAVTESVQYGESQELPDGRYDGVVKSCALAESQSSGRDQINLFVEIKSEEYAGVSAGIFMGLDEQSLSYTLGALRRLGYEVPEDPTGLIELVEEINEDKPELIVRVKNGFSGIDRGVGVEDEEDEDEPDVEEEEEDEDVEDSDEEEDEEGEESEEDEDEEEEGEDGEDEDDEDEDEEDDEEADDDDEEEEVEIAVGSTVSWEGKKGDMVGEIIQAKEGASKVKVKATDGKTYSVAVDDLSPVEVEDEEEEDEEEEVEEEPVKKPAKKTTKKAAKKPAKKAPTKKVTKKAPAKKAAAKKTAKKPAAKKRGRR